MPPQAKRPGVTPGVRVTKIAEPWHRPQWMPPIQTLMFRPVPHESGAETPHPLARCASGLDWRPRQSRTPIHFTERLPKKAPSLPAIDFAPHLWLSCNKPAPAPAVFARV